MSDLISREEVLKLPQRKGYAVNGWETYIRVSDIKELPSAEKHFKLPEIYVADCYDTIEDEDGNIGFGVYVPAENQIYVVGDVEDEIRARALLHEVCHWVQAMCGRPFDEDEANEFSDIVYDALPSAHSDKDLIHLQKEQAYMQGYADRQKPRRGKWIDYSDEGYVECPFCHSATNCDGNKDELHYCFSCGADMRGDPDEKD